MHQYDVIIIGAGPSGLNAALYTSRANLKTLIIEKYIPGGKVNESSKIENWLGTEYIEGFEFAQKTYQHALKFGAEYLCDNVVAINNFSVLNKEVVLESGKKFSTKTIIIATGTKHKEPTFIRNYENFIGKGISFCAICDGPFYKNKNIFVLGGGNSAIEESNYLSSIGAKIYIATNTQNFSAEKKLIDEIKGKKNVELFTSTNVLELQGKNNIEKVLINQEGKEKMLDIEGFFPMIGLEPAAQNFISNLNLRNNKGFLITNENMETSIRGIYAIGDIRDKEIRQIITAAADGAIAAKHISNLLNK